MEYVVYGKTGLKVSRIGFGGIPIQRDSAENAEKAIFAAMNEGINFIDSARGYTVSEEYIGKALRSHRKNFILATKSMASSYETMLSDIDKSRALLNTDFIDIYQAHCVKDVETLHEFMQPGGVFDALLYAKKQGKIRFIGITAHVAEVLNTAIDLYSDRIDSVMYPYNIVETHGSDIFRSARLKNIGTMAMKPFAGGNLTDTRLAIRFVLNNPDIDIALCGIGSDTEAKENASVILSPLKQNETDECNKLVRELGSRFCRRCGYCAPCTVGINIPQFFTLQNYLKNYDLAAWAKARYDAMPVKPTACIQCGKCMTRCPYNLDIINKLKSVVSDFEK